MYTLSILTLAAAVVSEITSWIIRRDWKFVKAVISITVISGLIYTVAFLLITDVPRLISLFTLYIIILYVVNIALVLIYVKADRIATVTLIVFGPLAALFAGYLVIGPVEPPGFVPSIIDHFTTRFNIGLLRIQDFEILLFIVSGSIYLTSPSNSLVRALLKSKGLDVKEKELDIGAYIGIVERWLIFALILLGNIGALAFILAAKTAVRYNKFKDKEDNFADYFLLGTLSSVGIALALGLFFKYVLLPFI